MLTEPFSELCCVQENRSPEFNRTHTWNARPKAPEPYSRAYTTLPGRGKVQVPHWDDEDRRRSADDLLDERDDPRYRRNTGGVALVSKEDLVRSYSPGGAHLGVASQSKGDSEIRRSLKDDVNLEHEPGERGFVRENIRRNEDSIKRQSGALDLEPSSTEVHTKTMTITSEVDPMIIRQTAAPEVETSVMTISGPGGRREVTESYTPSRITNQESAMDGRWDRPYQSGHRDYRKTVPSVPTRTVVYDPNIRPTSPSRTGMVIYKEP